MRASLRAAVRDSTDSKDQLNDCDNESRGFEQCSLSLSRKSIISDHTIARGELDPFLDASFYLRAAISPELSLNEQGFEGGGNQEQGIGRRNEELLENMENILQKVKDTRSYLAKPLDDDHIN